MADTLLGQYFDQTNDLMTRFDAYKLNAALLDFDDILIRTRTLLRANQDVRVAVAERYRYILVDEFQDTDPIQTEILFLIAGKAGAGDGTDLRPGALFLVGDPKQAIYRFRGADLKTYMRTRDIIAAQFPGNVLHISANFRSEKRILKHVDQIFSSRLTTQLGNYGELEGTIDDTTGRTPAIVRHNYFVKKSNWAFLAREAEAKAVAALCAGLVGNAYVRRSNGDIVLAEPGDIALLAPTGTDLWRYESALESHGLPVASQAGKNLYRRQEAQDIVALTCALADNRDTLALGAVLRGPLVGLTERELLDITQSLREDDDALVLRLSKEPLALTNDTAREAMAILQDLWRKRRGTTPHALLSEAVDRLKSVPSIALRIPDQRGRALANLGSLLERARSYQVRGLKQFAIDLAAEWESGRSFDEAPIDHSGDSIDIVTIHKAKGLEWPIVIPINLVSMSRRSEEFFFQADDNSVHWTLGDVASSTLDAAIADAKAEALNERERLLYVACTRALDCLIVLNPSWRRPDSWFTFFDLGQNLLQPMSVTPTVSRHQPAPQANIQTPEIFAAEAQRIVDASTPIVWLRPSIDDVDRETLERMTVEAIEGDEGPEAAPVVGAGALRGVLLHRLLEEVLSGLLPLDLDALTERAALLLTQVVLDGAAPPMATQLAATAFATLSHDELRPYLDKILVEVPLFGSKADNTLISARADAIALDSGVPIAAFDWKSDVDPSPSDRQAHKGQLAQYLQLMGAPRGAVVYLTKTEFCWIQSDGTDTTYLAAHPGL